MRDPIPTARSNSHVWISRNYGQSFVNRTGSFRTSNGFARIDMFYPSPLDNTRVSEGWDIHLVWGNFIKLAIFVTACITRCGREVLCSPVVILTVDIWDIAFFVHCFQVELVYLVEIFKSRYCKQGESGGNPLAKIRIKSKLISILIAVFNLWSIILCQMWPIKPSTVLVEFTFSCLYRAKFHQSLLMKILY